MTKAECGEIVVKQQGSILEVKIQDGDNELVVEIKGHRQPDKLVEKLQRE